MLASLSLVAVGTFPETEWWVAALRAAAASAALALLTSVFTAGQNALEDGGQIPGLLKAPASAGAQPIGTPAHELVERHVPEPGSGT